MLYKADTPRLRSTMQNICFLISISAVTLKLMVKITSIFGSYRFLRIAWHDIFLLSDLSDHFPASWNLYTMYPAVILRSRRENAHLLVNPIPKLTMVLIWKTPPCLKFGKTSNRDVKNLPQRKLWARSIQPKFRPVRPGEEDHLNRWTSFFETFPVGPNRSIEFWTEISGNFGWMDRALWVWAGNNAHSHKNLITPNFGERVLLRKR